MTSVPTPHQPPHREHSSQSGGSGEGKSAPPATRSRHWIWDRCRYLYPSTSPFRVLLVRSDSTSIRGAFWVARKVRHQSRQPLFYTEDLPACWIREFGCWVDGEYSAFVWRGDYIHVLCYGCGELARRRDSGKRCRTVCIGFVAFGW